MTDRSEGTVEVVAERDARLEEVTRVARAYRRKMEDADRARTDLVRAMAYADELSPIRFGLVSDAMLAKAANAAIPAGATALGRPLQISLMTVRRWLGKAQDSRRTSDSD